MSTLYLVAQGAEVVAQGKRRWVDPHWFRGSSYLKIGWTWVQRALVKGWTLISSLRLSGELDPDPVMSSRSQFLACSGPTFTVSFASFPPS